MAKVQPTRWGKWKGKCDEEIEKKGEWGFLNCLEPTHKYQKREKAKF